jgi:hypothetical protein
MSIWSSSSITNINPGTSANDGSGDNIRDAFIKVDTNLANVSQWLNASYVDFYNANVRGTVSTVWANVTNANLITLYGGNVTAQGANIDLSANIIPTGVGGASFDLGSPTRPFRTLYVQATVSTTQVQASSDAGLLLVHANTSPGDVKDVGILGNVSNHYGSNTYAFFGYQAATNNLVYKITPNNAATIGNSVVYDGIYGNAQLGSLFLSNATVSTSPWNGVLVVGGGAGIAGVLNTNANAYINGTIFSRNNEVITTSIIGNYGSPYTGGIIAGNTVFLSASVSTNANTGAVTIPYGGLGAFANIVSGAGMVAPSFYGQMRTADQPYITSLGTLPTLNAVSGSFTSLGTIGLTTTGAVNLAGPTLTVTSNTTITNYANITSGVISGGNVSVATSATVGNLLSVGNTVSIGNTLNVGGNISFAGNSYNIGNSTYITANFSGINTATAQTIDSFSALVYGSAKYLVQVVDLGYTPNKVETAELTLVHDRNGASTLVYVNTYGVVANAGDLGTFLGSYSAGTIRLQFTPSYTPTSMSIKLTRTAVTL